MGPDTFRGFWPSACNIVGTTALHPVLPFSALQWPSFYLENAAQAQAWRVKGQDRWLGKEQCFLLSFAWLPVYKRLKLPWGCSLRGAPRQGDSKVYQLLVLLYTRERPLARTHYGTSCQPGGWQDSDPLEGIKVGTHLEIWSHWVQEMRARGNTACSCISFQCGTPGITPPQGSSFSKLRSFPSESSDLTFFINKR